MLEAGSKGMTALEGTTVHPTSEIVALDDEFGAEFPGAFAVGTACGP